MDHYANKGKQPAEAAGSYSPPFHVPDLRFHKSAPTLHSPCASSLNFEVEEGGSRDDTNWFGTDEFSPFSNQVNDPAFLESSEGAEALHSVSQQPLVPEKFSENLRMNSKPSSSTPQVSDKKQLKRQRTSTTTSADDFHERFLRLKKEEIDRFAAIEEKKMEDPYSIKNCVTTHEGMAELLQIEDMIKAADIFKDNPANREVFLSFSTDELRLGSLCSQI